MLAPPLAPGATRLLAVFVTEPNTTASELPWPGHDGEMHGDDDDEDRDGYDDDDDGCDEAEVDLGADIDRAPLCPNCGVTALPAYQSNVIDSHFVCDNDGCDAFGEPV